MTRRLLSTIANALTPQPDESVHFHGGANGAYPCHDPRCVSPSLDPNG